MTTVALTASPATIDPGTAYELTVLNSGSSVVHVQIGGGSVYDQRLNPGQSVVVHPNGQAVTGFARSGSGQVDTTLATNPEVVSSGTSVSLADLGAWATTTAYAVGDIVTQNGLRYVAKTAHTSGTFSTDLAAAKWTALDALAARVFRLADYGTFTPNDSSSDIGAAWDAAMTAIFAAGGGTLLLPAGKLYCTRALQTAGGQNAQLPIPVRLTSANKVLVDVVGSDASGNVFPYVGQTAPQDDGGTIIVSTLTGQTTTNGIPAIIGGPAAAVAGNTLGFSNVLLRVRNVTIRQPAAPTLCTVYGEYLAQMEIEGVLSDTQNAGGQWLAGTDYPAPTVTTGAGPIFPRGNNNALSRCRNSSSLGLYVGFVLSEHVEADYLLALKCRVGYGIAQVGLLLHQVIGGFLRAELCPYVLAGWTSAGGVAAMANVHLDIRNLQVEPDVVSGVWSLPVVDIYDSSTVYGKVRGLGGYSSPEASGRDPLTCTDGTNLKIENMAAAVETPLLATSDLSGLLFDLDADTLGADGAAVSAWGTFVQATGANQPTVKAAGPNGHKTVLFTGGTQGLASPSAVSLGAFTIFAIALATTGATLLYEHGTNSGSSDGSFLDAETASNVNVRRTGQSRRKRLSNGLLINSGYRMWVHRYGGSGASSNRTAVVHQLRRDGVNDYLIEDVSGTLGSGAVSATLYLGARGGTTAGWVGEIARFIVYNRCLSNAEIRRVENYLAARYLRPVNG